MAVFQETAGNTHTHTHTHTHNVMERWNRLSERKVIGGRSEQRAPFILVVLSAVWRAGDRPPWAAHHDRPPAPASPE